MTQRQAIRFVTILVPTFHGVTTGRLARARELVSPNAPRPPIRGILYNEDDSHRFVIDPPGKMEPARLDQLVDELANSEVTVMLICCCAQNTAFDSKTCFAR